MSGNKKQTVCEMIREARMDETKGNKFYQRMASKLNGSDKKTVSNIAKQERHHKGKLKKMGKELGCQ